MQAPSSSVQQGVSDDSLLRQVSKIFSFLSSQILKIWLLLLLERWGFQMTLWKKPLLNASGKVVFITQVDFIIFFTVFFWWNEKEGQGNREIEQRGSLCIYKGACSHVCIVMFWLKRTTQMMVIPKIILSSDVPAVLVCVSTIYDVLTSAKSPNNTFLRMPPVIKQCMTVCTSVHMWNWLTGSHKYGGCLWARDLGESGV
jgi:hypothetical protein